MPLPDLTDQFISDTYGGLIHTSNIPISSTSVVTIYEGLGNKTSFKLGKDGYGASFSGCLSADCLKTTITTSDTVYADCIFVGNSIIGPECGGTYFEGCLSSDCVDTDCLRVGNTIIGSDCGGHYFDGCLSADCINIGGFTILNYLYPIGSIFFSSDDNNPSTRFSGTTWVKIGEGKVFGAVDDDKILEGNNDGNYEIPFPNHYHGVGKILENTQDEGIFITAKDINPEPGWSDTVSYTGAKISGEGQGGYYTITNGFSANDALITTGPFNTGTLSATNTIPLSTKPPIFGVYAWKRTA